MIAADFLTLPLSGMESRIARFEERVAAAQAANPPTKDLVQSALHRRGAPRCPVRLKRLSFDVIVRHADALSDLFSEFADDVVLTPAYEAFVGYQPPDREPHIHVVQALMQAAEWTDEWGTRWGHAFGGSGATPVDYPIRDASEIDTYIRTRMPDPRAPGRLQAVRQALAPHRETKYCGAIIHLALFERMHCLRGMAELFVDLASNDREMRCLCEALTGYLLELVRQYGEMGIDALFFTDDWGTQTGLMISPRMWRSYFKPCYRTVFDETHRLGMDVIFHSCGNVTAIVPELIDLGVDVLDPVQPGAMDHAAIGRQFGGKIAFSGGIDLQHLISSGRPQEIKDNVNRVLDALARPFGNAMLIGPANVLTGDVPLENLRALFEVCHGQ